MNPRKTPTLTENEKERLANLVASLPASTDGRTIAAQAIGEQLSIDTAAACPLVDDLLAEKWLTLKTATVSEMAVNRVEQPEGSSLPSSKWFRTEKKADGA